MNPAVRLGSRLISYHTNVSLSKLDLGNNNKKKKKKKKRRIIEPNNDYYKILAKTKNPQSIIIYKQTDIYI